jgi:hypothetical protein
MKRKRRFQMRPRWYKPAGKQQVSTGAEVPQNKPTGIIALTAQTQKIFVQALRQIELAAI